MSVITPDAGWCWFGDPRALYHNGFLYYGWVDTAGHIWVAQVDTATWTRRRTLISPDTTIDDHNNPSLVIRGDRVCVFWCGHNGGTMRYRVAVNTDSIEEFRPVTVCAAGNTPGNVGFTYPNPVQMAHGNALYLFWRGGNHQPTYSRSTSVTLNRWPPARHLFAAGTGVRPYVKVAADGQARIHFLLTDGHPHDVATSIYYVRWHLDDGTFRTANGRVIGDADHLPIPVANLERLYDGSRNPRAWVWELQLAPDGRPHAVFAVLHARERHDYWAARWNGTSWQVTPVCDAGGTIAQNNERFYSGGIALDPLNLDVVALSRPGSPQGLHRIEGWTTHDHGGTWERYATITDGSSQAVRPFYVRGAPAGMNWRLLWLQGTYNEFSRYYRLMLVGAEPPGP